jgi:signal transduction histidine kinase
MAVHLAADGGIDRAVVLIVDDERDNLSALSDMLRRDDIEIVAASSGRAALDILARMDVAVAIVDVQMPGMGGYELAGLIRKDPRTRYVPIIFLTASTREESGVFEGYESGAVDYLFKPVDSRILRSKIDVFVLLEEQRQLLRQADHMREMFIGSLGHDLRNPLYGIIMSAQVVIDRTTDAAIGDAAQRILRNSDRMVRMIDQLLDASRFRVGGGIMLSLATVDLEELTKRILTEFESVKSRFELEVFGNPVGTWDEDRFLEVVSNLVGNAVQHSPPDSPIHIRIQGQPADTVVFEVQNSGPPIPESLREVIFEPFRGSSSGIGRPQRLGLGLYISRQIVVAHGGLLSFESSEEAGTSFSVKLPRSAAAREGKRVAAIK